MSTTTKEKPKPGCLNDGSKLEPNDKIFCDPEYTWDHVDDKKEPTLKIPANVIKVVGSHVAQVEILDEEKNGKRANWNNTDEYGNTCYVILSTITRRA